MRTGKLPPAALARNVLAYLGTRRSDVLVHAQLGEDSAVIDFGNSVCVLSTDPITGAAKRTGWLAVNIACNDVAACGAQPVGVLATLLVPEHSTEAQIGSIMRELSQAAQELGIEVLGGHTEVTPGITSPIVSLTAVGRASKDAFVTSSGAVPGDDIIITKAAAIEGTAILATDFEGVLAEAVGPTVVRQAQALMERISVVPEGMVAARHGATAMHDATEGGILGALWELAQASEVGLEVWPEAIPIWEETRRICAFFGADPLKLVASGSLLITSHDSGSILSALRQAGIPATVIGKVGAKHTSLLLLSEGERRELETVERDELWRILEMKRE